MLIEIQSTLPAGYFRHIPAMMTSKWVKSLLMVQRCGTIPSHSVIQASPEDHVLEGPVAVAPETRPQIPRLLKSSR